MQIKILLRPRMHFPPGDTPQTANKVDYDSFYCELFDPCRFNICKTSARETKLELLRIFKETRNQEVERFCCRRTEWAPS